MADFYSGLDEYGKPMPFTPAELEIITLARHDFGFFLKYVYPLSFQGRTFRMADGERHPFQLGAMHYRWARRVQDHPRGCYLSARGHLKSTVLNHGQSMWKLFRGPRGAGGDIDGFVFSYNDRLAREHTQKTRQAIAGNPFCRFWIDRKGNAESLIEYEVRFDDKSGWLGKVDPYGILTNTRGGHPKFVICDDILSDWANPVEPTVIKRIDRVFQNSIESQPEEDETLCVVGTPQSYEDTLFRLRGVKDYFWGRYPAEFGGPNLNSFQAWPQKYDARRLRRTRRRVGVDGYQVEYLLVPYSSVNSYLPESIVRLAVSPELENADLDDPWVPWPGVVSMYGGMDIGKEVHPSHVAILAKMETGDLVEVFHTFLDGMPYNEQANLVNRLIKHFRVQRFLYDNTRAEMDDRNMSRRALGQKFTKKLKAQIALQMEHYFYGDADEGDPGIVLIPDKRQVNSLVSVDKTLNAPDTVGAHGDCFWSLALAVEAAKQGPVMVNMGNAQDMLSLGGRRTSGIKPELAPAS